MTENLPVSWEEQMAADAKSQLANERPAMSLMSLKSGIMSIGGEPVPNNEIEAIIVASIAENQYYSKPYDPDVIAIPDCYALGEGKNEHLAPMTEAKEKQNADCKTCPKFEWGSSPTGGRGKACKERRRLALIAPDGSDEMILLTIPPTSLKNWANHVSLVVATTGMSTAGVVTKVKVVPSIKNQFEVKFSLVREVGRDMMPLVMSKKDAALAALLAPYPEIDEEEQAKPAKKRKF